MYKKLRKLLRTSSIRFLFIALFSFSILRPEFISTFVLLNLAVGEVAKDTLTALGFIVLGKVIEKHTGVVPFQISQVPLEQLDLFDTTLEGRSVLDHAAPTMGNAAAEMHRIEITNKLLKQINDYVVAGKPIPYSLFIDSAYPVLSVQQNEIKYKTAFASYIYDLESVFYDLSKTQAFNDGKYRLAHQLEEIKDKHHVSSEFVSEYYHRVKLVTDANYAEAYKERFESLFSRIVSLVSASNGERIVTTQDLFNHPLHNLHAQDRVDVTRFLQESRSLFVDEWGAPRPTISEKDRQKINKNFYLLLHDLTNHSASKDTVEKLRAAAQQISAPHETMFASLVSSYIKRLASGTPQEAKEWLFRIKTNPQNMCEREYQKIITHHGDYFEQLHQTFKTEWKKHYTSDGFLKIGVNDPLLTSLSKEARKRLSKDKKERKLFNGKLAIRAAQHDVIKKELQIPFLREVKAKKIDTCIYKLTDLVLDGATPHKKIDCLVDEVSEDIFPYFFDKKGITKLHRGQPAVTGASHFFKFATHRDKEILRRLNYLAMLDQQHVKQEYIDRLYRYLELASQAQQEEVAQRYLNAFNTLFPLVSCPQEKIELLHQAFAAVDQALNPVPVLLQESQNQPQQKIPSSEPGGSSGGQEPKNKKSENDIVVPDKEFEHQTNNQLRKSRESCYKQKIVHQKKLENFKKDPNKYDHKNFLKNASSEDLREKIIRTRIQHLNDEINSFDRKIKKITEILLQRGAQ